MIIVKFFRMALDAEGFVSVLAEDPPPDPDFNTEPKIVARTDVDDARFVSTAFLPFCMGSSEDNTPMCFEIVIVRGPGRKTTAGRYSNFTDAVRAHDAAVEQLKAGVWN